MQARRSVFISATTRGFAPWRKVISEVLQAQEVQPREETWFQPEREVIQAHIEAAIRSVTGVICLVGPYYGHPSDKTFDGGRPLSYTQCEWFWATKHDKPRLVYVIEDSFFGEKGIESEEDPRLPDSSRFREWQVKFRQSIKADEKKRPHWCIGSPAELGIRLAMINWRKWPDERRQCD